MWSNAIIVIVGVLIGKHFANVPMLSEVLLLSLAVIAVSKVYLKQESKPLSSPINRKKVV
jgi:hypothetical protein